MQTSYLPAERDNFLRGQMLAFNARVPGMTLQELLTNSQIHYKICLKNTPDFLAATKRKNRSLGGKKKQISSKGF